MPSGARATVGCGEADGDAGGAGVGSGEASAAALELGEGVVVGMMDAVAVAGGVDDGVGVAAAVQATVVRSAVARNGAIQRRDPWTAGWAVIGEPPHGLGAGDS